MHTLNHTKFHTNIYVQVTV